MSNFENIPGGLIIPEDFIIPSLRGTRYPSVENAFQACKYAISSRPEIADELSMCTSKIAKTLGSKSGMRKNNTCIDVAYWNSLSYQCMYQLVQARVSCDDTFHSILKKYRGDGKRLYHFERSGAKSYWGGFFKNDTSEWVGQNNLGRIMEKVVI